MKQQFLGQEMQDIFLPERNSLAIIDKTTNLIWSTLQ